MSDNTNMLQCLSTNQLLGLKGSRVVNRGHSPCSLSAPRLSLILERVAMGFGDFLSLSGYIIFYEREDYGRCGRVATCGRMLSTRVGPASIRFGHACIGGRESLEQ